MASPGLVNRRNTRLHGAGGICRPLHLRPACPGTDFADKHYKNNIDAMKIFKNARLRLFLSTYRTLCKGKRQVLVLFAFIIIAVAISIAVSFAVSPEDVFAERLYRIVAAFIDPGSSSYYSETVLRWPAVFVSVLGMILFCGLLISVISNIMERHIERFRNGSLSCRMKGHVVITGFGDMVPSIIRFVCNRDNDTFVLLQSPSDIEEIASRLHAELDNKQEKRVVLVNGKRDSKEDLHKLWLNDADSIFVIGNEDEYDHDSLNLECVKKITEVLEEEQERKERSVSARAARQLRGLYRTDGPDGKRLCSTGKKVTVLLNFQTSYAAFQTADLSEKWKKNIDLRVLNFHENWAKRVLIYRNYSVNGNIAVIDELLPEGEGIEGNRGKEKCPGKSPLCGISSCDIVYPPLDREPITCDSCKYVHFIIYGMTRMGTAMGVEAAHRLHFPNFTRDSRLKSVITFIDTDADVEMNYFVSRYSHLFNMAESYFYFPDSAGRRLVKEKVVTADDNDSGCPRMELDIEFRFVKGGNGDPAVRSAVDEWARDENAVTTIAVCLNHPHQAAASGLYLPSVIYEKGIPVLIRQRTSGALLAMLKDCKDSRYSNIYPFGMTENCYYENDFYLDIAKKINYLYYLKNNKNQDSENEVEPGADMFSDRAAIEKEWKILPVAKKWSSLYAACFYDVRLRSAGLSKWSGILSEQDVRRYFRQADSYDRMMQRTEHNRWVMEKYLFSFRGLNDCEREKAESMNDKERENYMRMLKNQDKIHGCMVRYDLLSDDMKDNDDMVVRRAPEIFKSASGCRKIPPCK